MVIKIEADALGKKLPYRVAVRVGLAPSHAAEPAHAAGRLHAAKAARAAGRLHAAEAAHATGRLHAAEAAHATGRLHAAEAAHATGRLNAAEPSHAAARERSAVKARSNWLAEVVVIQLMEITEVMKVMKAVEVMETIHEDEAYTRADENRRPPPPGVRIRVGGNRIPQHAAIGTLLELPCPVTLQARAPDDLLHRTVDVRLPGDRAAIGAVGLYG